MTKHGQSFNCMGISAQIKEDKTFLSYFNIVNDIIIGLKFDEINLQRPPNWLKFPKWCHLACRWVNITKNVQHMYFFLILNQNVA